MTFDEILLQVTELLQRQGRVSYGALKRRYGLDDAYLQDLKDELIEAQQIAADEDGKILVWIGQGDNREEGERTKGRKGEDGLESRGQRPEAQHVQSPRSEVQGPKSKVQSQTSQSPAPNPQPLAAERRQLTVMFCDLVDSTALSSQLDPEELRFVVQQYQEVCAKVIERYEGYIAQYLGDGVLVYFGYPTAHEDDAQRAVLAGLDIIQSLRAQQFRLSGVPQLEQRPIHARIGIHTGLVVVGEVGGGNRHEQLALGETPNIAARLQGVAEPDTIVLSAMTQRLVAGYFVCHSIGERTFKGVAQPLEVYQVIEQSQARNRLEILAPSHLTPIVGRDEEIEFLRKCWGQASEGQGQVVLLSGEAGIGKSRLVRMLKEQVVPTTALRLEARCSSYQQNSSLHPMIEFLHRSLSLRREDSPDEQLKKLEHALVLSGMELSSTLPFFAALLSLSSARFPLPEVTPQKLREKTHQAMLLWLLKSTEYRPVLSIWEDLHWADPSTLEWLGLLIEQAVAARVLVVLTFRPEFVPPWPQRSYSRPLTLSRLTSTDVERMIDSVGKGKQFPAEIVEQLVIKTDGVPLFVEESTKMLLESGLMREDEDRYVLTGSLPPLAIPTTLQDSLVARLDRLGEAREVAQIGATYGREFPYAVMKVLVPLDEVDLRQSLKKLVDADLLYPRGVGPQMSYMFRHALIQDAAYQSLLKSKRQLYHQRIAVTIETQFPEMIDAEPELLAHHYTEAGLTSQAIAYWQKAGQSASQRSANAEAIHHLQKALALLVDLPDTAARVELELTLQTLLGVPLMATKGYAALEVESTYARAHELCHRIGETPQLFHVISGLFAFYLVRGKLQTARTLAEQALRLAENMDDPTLLLEAYRMLGNALYFLGEFSAALRYLEQAIALYDRQPQRPVAFLSGQDPGVACRSFAAWSLWMLGYLDQAQARSEESIALGRQSGHANTLALALGFAAYFRNTMREWGTAKTYAEETVSLAEEQGLLFWQAAGTFNLGLALSYLGQPVEGLEKVYQGIAMYQATGAELVHAGNLANLAGILGATGRVDEGLEMVTEALSLTQKSSERALESPLYLIHGGLVIQTGRPQKGAEAEHSFRTAITVARQVQAKILELRATMGLARLWQYRGKRAEAHKVLSEIYGQFTEGFDTPDLKDARAVLEGLA